MSNIPANTNSEVSDLNELLESLAAGKDLTREQARSVMAQMLEGRATPSEMERLLTLLHQKVETVDELVGFAEAMRHAAHPLFDAAQPRPDGVLVDTCGTGGDGRGTFNISTAAALVVAAAGVRVAKHGNRSITSRCGSADVLEALGVDISASPSRMAESIREVGIGFLFAPFFHAATRHVQPVRRKLKFRTVFNLLGPLTNPAAVEAQVVGVFSPEWLEPMAHVLGQLGVRRGYVVHSADGMDEVSLAGETTAAEFEQDTGRCTVRLRTLTANDFGLHESSAADLAGGDAATNAEIIRSILGGTDGPPADVVVANAALALVAAGAAEDLRSAAALARDTIRSGSAARRLERFAEFSHGRD